VSRSLDWERFVLAHGWRAWLYDLAAVLGKSSHEIDRVRRTRACTRLGKIKHFAELFSLWQGRAPRDDEWPLPRRSGTASGYEWQAPELAFLATLVGRFSTDAIAKILTKRLREKTGDRRAKRTRWGVLIAMQHKLGLLHSDVCGGITLAKAGREIGSYAIAWQAIERRELRAFRIGKMWIIPHAAWSAWKASRVFPPKGYVQLSTLKKPLGIRSDKLSEWARMGYMPTALRCNPYGTRAKNTKFGSWYVDRAVAAQLVRDRRLGKPMPWWGKPEPGNLQVTWKLLEERRHPTSCKTCAQIWGPEGAPRTYDDYAVRYPPLAHGAKRHLTRKWSPGLTMKEVAKLCSRSWGGVRLAIMNGTLPATRVGVTWYVTRTDATRWKARRCPGGGDQKSWLSVAAACQMHEFKRVELLGYIKDGALRSKLGTNGPMRGITYVLRNQVAMLRQKLGYSLQEGARRARVTVARFRKLLEGVNWRGASGIPLDTVNAVIKRIESREGYTIEEAAAAVRTTRSWIKERILDGTIRVQRAKWDGRRVYITAPMLERLRRVKRKPIKHENFTDAWIFLGPAAALAGVSTSTIQNWHHRGELRLRRSHLGARYSRRQVKACARRYWKAPKFLRAVPPEWLLLERVRPAANEERTPLRLVA
jgi:hypothetical protein